MRKTLMIFLALVLVCGCGAAFAAQAVSAPREDIAFQEHIFSGSVRAVPHRRGASCKYGGTNFSR